MRRLFNITAERLNTTGRWYAAVRQENKKVDRHEFCSMVVERTGVDRRYVERVLEAIGNSVVECLSKGAEVRVDDLLTISPVYQLRDKISGTREDVMQGIEGLTPYDVTMTAKVHLTHCFVYKLKQLQSLLMSGVRREWDE